MNARFMLEKPEEVQATMKITMTLRQWIDLREQLDQKWPSAGLSQKITELVCEARKVFYSTIDEKEAKEG